MENKITYEEQTKLNNDYLKAVLLGDENIVLKLLKQNADINAVNTNGDNAIFIAADRRKRNVFEFLLDYISETGEKINLDNRNLIGETAIMQLVNSNNYEYYIEELVKYNANPSIVNKNKLSPLIRASSNAKTQIVKSLLSSPLIDVNYTIPDTKTTAFLMATAQADLESAVLLFNAGANVNAIDSHGKTALMNALTNSNFNHTKKEAKKYLNLCLSLCDLCDINYTTPNGISAFFLASVYSRKESCLYMIEKGVNVDITHDHQLEGKMSALHIWCKKGDPQLIEQIITHGGKLGVKDENNNTPEAYAFMRPNLRNFIWNYGIDPNTIYYDKKVRVPIFSIVTSGGDKQIKLVKDMILKGANVTYKDKDLVSTEPIIIAISSCSRLITDELIKTKKIDLNRIYKLSEDSPEISLIGILLSETLNSGLSASLQKKNYFDKLIKQYKEAEKRGEFIDDKTKQEFENIEKEMYEVKNLETDLSNYRIEIFKNLLKNGASLNLENNEGLTEAFFTKNPQYLQLLSEHGANIFHENKEGQDLLYYSVLHNQKNNINYLKEEYTKQNHKTVDNIFYQLAFEKVENYIKQKNIENGMYSFLDVENNSDLKKLIIGKFEEGESIAQIHIPQIHFQDEDGNSALLVACANGNGYLVGPFLRMGADINLKNNDGETALMHSLATESIPLIQFLIKNGANINDVNNNGVSIFDMAQELGNQSIIEELNKEFKNREEKSLSLKL